MKKDLIFLEPVLKETIWGGSRIKDEFNMPGATDTTGECWCISAHSNGDCVVKNGEYKGKTLSRLWKENRELFGEVKGTEFPILIKIIDAKADLSIQVHPDNDYAAKYENGSLGKKECWYVLDCEPDCDIVIGHNAKTKEELVSMIEERKWKELIRQIPVQKGDFFQINPGTVHAIKAGTLILETQQSSDITYRVYDYDRLSDGKPRELHLEKSIDVIKVPFTEEKTARKDEELLVECDEYTVRKIAVNLKKTIKKSNVFKCVTVISGEGTVNDVPVKKGDSFIISANNDSVEFVGNMEIMVACAGC